MIFSLRMLVLLSAMSGLYAASSAGDYLQYLADTKNIEMQFEVDHPITRGDKAERLTTLVDFQWSASGEMLYFSRPKLSGDPGIPGIHFFVVFRENRQMYSSADLRTLAVSQWDPSKVRGLADCIGVLSVPPVADHSEFGVRLEQFLETTYNGFFTLKSQLFAPPFLGPACAMLGGEEGASWFVPMVLGASKDDLLNGFRLLSGTVPDAVSEAHLTWKPVILGANAANWDQSMSLLFRENKIEVESLLNPLRMPGPVTRLTKFVLHLDSEYATSSATIGTKHDSWRREVRVLSVRRNDPNSPTFTCPASDWTLYNRVVDMDTKMVVGP